MSETGVTGTPFPVDQATLRAWMIRYITSVLDVPAEDFPSGARFDTYGLDSVEAVVMAGVMEEEFGVPVDPMQLFEHHSVDAFVAAYAQPVGRNAGA